MSISESLRVRELDLIVNQLNLIDNEPDLIEKELEIKNNLKENKILYIDNLKIVDIKKSAFNFTYNIVIKYAQLIKTFKKNKYFNLLCLTKKKEYKNIYSICAVFLEILYDLKIITQIFIFYKIFSVVSQFKLIIKNKSIRIPKNICKNIILSNWGE